MPGCVSARRDRRPRGHAWVPCGQPGRRSRRRPPDGASRADPSPGALGCVDVCRGRLFRFLRTCVLSGSAGQRAVVLYPASRAEYLRALAACREHAGQLGPSGIPACVLTRPVDRRAWRVPCPGHSSRSLYSALRAGFFRLQAACGPWMDCGRPVAVGDCPPCHGQSDCGRVAGFLGRVFRLGRPRYRRGGSG